MRYRQLFLVLQAARSGSDWLMSLLNAHPAICMPAGRVDVPAGHDPTVLVSKVRAREAARPGHNVTAAFEASANARVAIAARDNGRCAAFGWKQGLWLAKGYATEAHRAEFAAWVARRGVKLVLLRRVGVARVVSGAKNRLTPNATLLGAEASRNVHCTSASGTPSRRGGAAPPPRAFRVTYDELVADTPRWLGELYDFLGVGPPPKPPRTAYVKSGGRAADSIENLDEVRAALAGTEWAAELEDG
ncbi:hypothetical protein JL721_3910 [Aureococcus anophagefferens]|nr:hypothetical protein JL721_3910 [Aureococcus anophagefferens]